jgi:peptide deformylase
MYRRYRRLCQDRHQGDPRTSSILPFNQSIGRKEPAGAVAILARVADETLGELTEETTDKSPDATASNVTDESPEDGGEDARPALDPVVEARRRAALAHVRVFGDPALRTRASAVETFDDALLAEIGRMTRLMGDALGVGLAATQLGVMHRVLVYRAGPDAPVVAVVNPEIEWSSSEKETAEEACLSIPGVAVDVERPLHVRVHAQDEHGKPILIEASGLDARVVQHEMDHLDGVLILDRTSKEQRKEALRTLREGSGRWPAPDETLEPSAA